VLGRTEERAVPQCAASGQLSLGPRVPEFERAYCPGAWGQGGGIVLYPADGWVTSGVTCVGVEDGDDGPYEPVSFVASANAAVYERAKPGVLRISIRLRSTSIRRPPPLL